MRFWTSDYHFGNPYILEYSGRKFKNINKMTTNYINQANSTAYRSEDVLIHVGDFMCYGRSGGVEGLRIKAGEYLKRFKCRVVLIEGNHDKTNKVKCDFKSCMIDLGPFKFTSVGHYPSYYDLAKGTFLPGTLRICGHIHGYDSWRWLWDAKNQVLNINVGIDHWGKLLSDNDIIVYAKRIIDQIQGEKLSLRSICNRFELWNIRNSSIYQFPKNMPTESYHGDLCKRGSPHIEKLQ